MKLPTGRLAVLLFSMVIIARAAVTAQSAILIVTNTQDAGIDSLRTTVAVAGTGDTIEFDIPTSDSGYDLSTGVFTITLTSGEIVIDKDLTINGPSAANIAINGDHASRIFHITAGTVSISKLSLINGRAQGADGFNSYPTYEGMPGTGGAVLNQGTLLFRDCTFMENLAIGGTGGTIGGRSPAKGGDGQGGAICNQNTLSLVACTLVANSAVGGLGGVGSSSGWTSGGAGGVGSGGAVYNSDTAILSLTNCTIAENSAVGADAQSTTFCGTGAAAQGGGIANFGALAIVHCTLANNTALGGDSSIGAPLYGVPDGGAGSGGGLYGGAGAVSSTRDTIFAPNDVVGGAGGGLPEGPHGNSGNTMGPEVGGAVSSEGHNLVGRSDGSAGFGTDDQQGGTTDDTRLDPRLGLLGDYGGSTQTFPLLPDSPAINAGNTAGPSRDQRNFLRAGTPDIGAFEFQGTQPVRLANISTRLRVETGDNALIGGLIVTGQHDKKVLLRAIGPSLPLSEALENPILYLYNSVGQLVATNDDWQDAANHAEIADTGIAPTNALESAILVSLAPGSYTAIVRGGNNPTGIGLVEAYDLDPTVDSKLGNISTRGLVQTGNNVLIGGFIVAGEDEQRVIVRAIGPSLTVAGALSDPTLELRDGNGALISSNDDWRSTQQSEIVATGIPPANDAESAIVSTLTPGPYTAIVRGKNGTTGIALVEVYNLN